MTPEEHATAIGEAQIELNTRIQAAAKDGLLVTINTLPIQTVGHKTEIIDIFVAKPLKVPFKA